MNAANVIRRITDSEGKDFVCVVVVLRSGADGIEALTQKNNSGDWGLCGGHPRNGETPQETAERELEEESGIKTTVEYLSTTARHDRRKASVKYFFAVVDADTEAEAGSDAKKVKWRSIKELSKLGANDQNAVRQAAKRVHDPDAIVREAVEASRFPVQTLCVPLALKGPAGILIAVEGKDALRCAKALQASISAQGGAATLVPSKLSLISESYMSEAHQHKKLTAVTEALLRSADALNWWETEIKPRLDRNEVVICAPWVNEHRAHLLRRGLPEDMYEATFRWVPKPDLLIEATDDIDPESYVKNFVNKDLGVTFLIHRSGEKGVYGAEPYDHGWLAYSNDKVEPEDYNQDDPAWEPQATRTFEGYLQRNDDGTWCAILNGKAITQTYGRRNRRQITPKLSDPYPTPEQAAYALYIANRK